MKLRKENVLFVAAPTKELPISNVQKNVRLSLIVVIVFIAISLFKDQMAIQENTVPKSVVTKIV